MSRRGRTVAGTSAKRNRTARRRARQEEARHREGGITPPATVMSPEELVEAARAARARQQAGES